MNKLTVSLVVGTRPEAIKMAPVYRALDSDARFEVVLISSGQHRELLASAFSPLGLSPDHELSVMADGQTPSDVAARVLERLPPLLESNLPDALLVQGDTTTVLASALAAYHMKIPIGHVEAGLRTHDHRHPFPEEANRQLVDRLCRWCFAPTETARQNLLAERLDSSAIHVTGNTAVDSLLWMLDHGASSGPTHSGLLITLHRRESFGQPLIDILMGIRDFLEAVPEASAVWPVHPNPNVARIAREVFQGIGRIELTPPLEYSTFAATLAGCRLVLTDSGGIQEEAPSLGKTVLVAREVTERPEALTEGRNRLVGRSREGVRAALLEGWREPPYRGPLPAPNPYGDGRAGERIADILSTDL